MDNRYLILGGLLLLIGILYLTGSPWILTKKFRGDARIKPYLRKVGTLFCALGVLLALWAVVGESLKSIFIVRMIFFAIIIAAVVYWFITNHRFSKMMETTPIEENAGKAAAPKIAESKTAEVPAEAEKEAAEPKTDEAESKQ